MTERAHAVSPVTKVSDAIRNFPNHAKGAPLGELLSAAKLRGYPIKTSIPRFLPVENSLQLCYDRKQRIFPKIDSEEGNGSCVKVVF